MLQTPARHQGNGQLVPYLDAVQVDTAPDEIVPGAPLDQPTGHGSVFLDDIEFQVRVWIPEMKRGQRPRDDMTRVLVEVPAHRMVRQPRLRRQTERSGKHKMAR